MKPAASQAGHDTMHQNGERPNTHSGGTCATCFLSVAAAAFFFFGGEFALDDDFFGNGEAYFFGGHGSLRSSTKGAR